MDSNGILSIVAVIISVAGSLFTIINHKRIRLKCCGSKEIVIASLDIENTTPPQQDDKPKSPRPENTVTIV